MKHLNNFKQLISSHLGLYFPENKKYLLENRLRARLTALNCETFEDYYEYLQFDPKRKQEYVELVNIITTNETFFFRDQGQIDCLRLHLLPEIIERRSKERHLRIWSAGCSSGEEAYTLAMLLAEEFGLLSSWQIEIFATDISEQILMKAREGIYGDYAVRNIPPAWLKKYFTTADGQYTITALLRQHVKFATLNLFDDQQMHSMRHMDVVLCRNVLIYFDQLGRKKIVSGFHDALCEHGVLMIGFSESLNGVAHSFHAVPWNKTMLYYKSQTLNDEMNGATGTRSSQSGRSLQTPALTLTASQKSVVRS